MHLYYVVRSKQKQLMGGKRDRQRGSLLSGIAATAAAAADDDDDD